MTTFRGDTGILEPTRGPRAVHIVLPDGVDDPARPSGGNTYDRKVCDGLAAIGWAVHERVASGGWPWPDAVARAGLAAVLAGLPEDSVVLLDGLIASTVPEVLVPLAGRLRLVVLVHLPLGDGPPGHQVDDAPVREHAVLSAAVAVITTSEWTRKSLIDRYALQPNQIHVAEPGVEPAAPAPGSAAGTELLCVAAVTEHKGHDVLLAALAGVTDLGWHCVCVGSLTREPDFVERLRVHARQHGISDRVLFTGPRTGADLDLAYSAADVVVLASRGETYGMVVTEALARGLPVIATAVGGLPDTLGRVADGGLPGLLVPPEDPIALAMALRRWLVEDALRQQLRQTALERRATLSDWSATAERISRVLVQAAA